MNVISVNRKIFVNFAEQLKALMKSRGVKQKTLSDGTGISQSAISNYANGRIPDRDELQKLADFFGVSVDFLLGRVPTEYPIPESGTMIMSDAPAKKVIAKLRQQVQNLQAKIDEINKTLDEL